MIKRQHPYPLRNGGGGGGGGAGGGGVQFYVKMYINVILAGKTLNL